MDNQFLLNGKTLSKQQAESSARKYLFAVYYDFSCTRIIVSYWIDIFRIQITQIKEQTKAREIAEDM